MPATPTSVPEKSTEVKIEKKDESGKTEAITESITIEATEVEEVQAAPPDESSFLNTDKQEGEALPEEGQPSKEIPPPVEETNIAPLEQVVASTEERLNQSEEGTKDTSQSAGRTEQVSQSQDTTEQKKQLVDKTEEMSQSQNTSEQVNQLEVRTEISESEERTEMVSQSQSTKIEISQSQNTIDVSQSEDKAEQTSQSEEKTSQMNQSEKATEVNQSKESISREGSRSSISKSDRSSNTTWYLVLDAKNDVWVEYQYKPTNNDDELLSLVKTIKDARITITGTPLPGNEERSRAMTLVSPQNAEVLKLNELKRSLKVRT